MARYGRGQLQQHGLSLCWGREALAGCQKLGLAILSLVGLLDEPAEQAPA
jgi:hypothetical protein